MEIFVFTDSIGEGYEVRHIVAISERGDGDVHYETNDGRWYSKKQLASEDVTFVDNLMIGDLICQRDSGEILTCKTYVLDLALSYHGYPPYDRSKYTNPKKSSPKGL